MGIFSKPEVVIFKESNNAKEYLKKLEALLPKARGSVKNQIQKEIAITKAGIVGEENILFELKNSNMDMFVLQDIYIETQDGRGAQIDFIVITSRYEFLIECKNLVGDIDIDSKGNFTRTLEYGWKKHKEGIYSPITQNERHMEILKEKNTEDWNRVMGAMIRSSFNLYYKSLVVLANPKTVLNDRYAKKEVKEKVIRADQLIKTIKEINRGYKGAPSSKKDMHMFAENLLKKNIEERKDYIKKYEDLVKNLELETEEITQNKNMKQEKLNNLNNIEVEKRTVSNTKKLICPRCGAELVLRTARRGVSVGKQFYGCSSFPRCRFIMNIKDEDDR